MPNQPTLSIDDLLGERQWLSQVALRLVKDVAAADDVAQETLVRAMGATSAAEAQKAGGIRGWLAVTARHVALDSARRAGRRREREEMAAQPDVVPATPADALANAELRSRLSQLVLELPETERDALILRFFEGLSYAEVAERVGAPTVGAVRQRVTRALRKLRLRLDGENGQGRAEWFPVALGLAKPLLRDASLKTGAATTLLGLTGAQAWIVGVFAAAAAFAGWFLLAQASGPPVARVADIGPGDIPDQRAEVAALAAPQDPGEEGARDTIDAAAVPREDFTEARSFRLVRSRTGAAVPGASWYLRTTGASDAPSPGGIDGPSELTFAVHERGQSSEQGIVTVTPPSSGLFQLVVLRGAGHATAAFAIDGGVKSGAPRDLRLGRGVTLRGRIQDDEGEPVQGARIRMVNELGHTVLAATSDPSGVYEVHHVAPIPRRLQRRRDGSVTFARTTAPKLIVSAASVVAGDSGTTWHTAGGTLYPPPLRLGGSGIVALPTFVANRRRIGTGLVIDPDGHPVQGARVTALTSGEFSPLQAGRLGHKHRDVRTSPSTAPVKTPSLLPSTTGADGRFHFLVGRLADGRLSAKRFAAIAPNGMRAEGRFEIPTDGSAQLPVTLRLEPASTGWVQLNDVRAPGGRLRMLPNEESPNIPGHLRVALHRRGARSSPPVRLLLELLPGGGISVPFKRSRAKRGWGSIDVDVPGYYPVSHELDGTLDGTDIRLEPAPRQDITLRFTGEHALVDQSAMVFLCPTDPKELPKSLLTTRLVSEEHSSCYGVYRRLYNGETRAFAWPGSKPAWLIVFPHAPQNLCAAAPIVVGPLTYSGTTRDVDVPIAPWKAGASEEWIDVDDSPTVPAY